VSLIAGLSHTVQFTNEGLNSTPRIADRVGSILADVVRFPANEIEQWARRYSYPRTDHHLNTVIRPAAQRQGYITRDQLLHICRWKSPRSAPKAEANDDPYVRELTKISFATTSERVRIETLTLLTGVSWPIASTILHYTISENYPILDVRALWSLGIQGTYSFRLWEAYVRECQRIASEACVTVRMLDKALWQYSKIRQQNLRNDD